MSFTDLNLHEDLLRALADKNYEEPTPIQKEAIPAVMNGSDVLAAAQTGTGKTAGFTLPLLNTIVNQGKLPRKHVRVLIVAPTRELAIQIKDNVGGYSKYLKLTSAVVYGGVKIHNHVKKLKQGVDVLVATPGRLLDLHKQNAVAFGKVRHLVLDEADRMLDMGFLPDINRIVNLLPEKKQTLLFSATFSKDIRKLAEQFLNKPVTIDVAPRNSTAESVNQQFYLIDKTKKIGLLQHLFKKENWYQCLVFTRTKYGADKVSRKLRKAGFKSSAIHGDKSQNHRQRALNDFKKNKVEILVATDIAARGLDIKELPHVVNYDVPQQAEDYVHRIGRTGRAGEEGHAVVFVSQEEGKYFREIEKFLKTDITTKTVEEFEPDFGIKDLPRAKATQSKKSSSNKKKKPFKQRGKDFNKPKNKSFKKKGFKKKSSKDGDNKGGKKKGHRGPRKK